MTLTSPCGVMPSLVLENPLTSQNSTVMTRRSPSAASAGPSSSPATTRGSTYLPKVSRSRSLSRNCSTIWLNAVVRWPISSREVATIVPCRLPASTARAPSSNRRTGRVTPVLTRAANTRPRTAASTVSRMEISITCCCLSTVMLESRRSIASHIRADAFELPVELVAEFVDALQFLVQRLLVAAIERHQQPPGLGVEAAPCIVVDGIDPALELTERR